MLFVTLPPAAVQVVSAAVLTSTQPAAVSVAKTMPSGRISVPLFDENHNESAVVAIGLDGKVDANDFTSPQGEPGIDNQLYRVVGCVAGLRTKGVIAEVSNRELRNAQFNRILLEITGVDDMVNDSSVEVTTWRGLDPLVEDVGRNVLPGTTQRLDLKRGGRFYCLEFSTTEWPGFKDVYDAYSHHLVPRLGQAIAGDAESYRYLVESIRRFPPMPAFEAMIREAGFVRTRVEPILGGVVAIHSGWKV